MHHHIIHWLFLERVSTVCDRFCHHDEPWKPLDFHSKVLLCWCRFMQKWSISQQTQQFICTRWLMSMSLTTLRTFRYVNLETWTIDVRGWTTRIAVQIWQNPDLGLRIWHIMSVKERWSHKPKSSRKGGGGCYVEHCNLTPYQKQSMLMQ